MTWAGGRAAGTSLASARGGRWAEAIAQRLGALRAAEGEHLVPGPQDGLAPGNERAFGAGDADQDAVLRQLQVADAPPRCPGAGLQAHLQEAQPGQRRFAQAPWRAAERKGDGAASALLAH